jgi:hypothetical protein
VDLPQLAEWRELNATPRQPRMGQRRVVPVPGQQLPLQLVAEQDEPLKLKDGRFCLLKRVVVTDLGTDGASKAAFEAFYRRQGTAATARRVAHFAPGWRHGRGGGGQGSGIPLGVLPEGRGSALSLEVPDGPV